MKTLLSAVVVLAMVSPVCADTVLIDEPFTGTTGNAISTLGWTNWAGDDCVKISDTVLDVGQSANTVGGDGLYRKSFTHTPLAGEQYVLTLTMLNPTTTGSIEWAVGLRHWGSYPDSVAIGHMFNGALAFGDSTATEWFSTAQPTTATDLKMVFSDNEVACSYRAHGAGSWTTLGTQTGLGDGYLLSNYDTVTIVSSTGTVATGGIDSIRLTCVPEPTTLALLVTGALGLLAYAWRRRK